MNISDQYSIAYKGLKNGTHHFDFEADDALIKAFENPEFKHLKAQIGVDLERSSSVLQLSVTIAGTVTVECDRCLDDVELPVDFNGVLEVKFSDEFDDYDGSVMWISPSLDRVELAQYFYESIVLSLPSQRVHPLDANGLPTCNPDMLSRFRIISADEFDRIASEQHTSPELQKLEQLKDKL